MHTRNGFTLLEMSIVLLIIATVLGSGLFMMANSAQQQQSNVTKERIAAIEKALLDYRRAYDKLPCPADNTIAIGNVAFGSEVVAGGVCSGAAPAIFSSGEIYAGIVPVRALNLPDDYAIDGWGRRMMYVVDRRLAANGAFITIPVTDTTARITIRSASGATTTNTAAYVLLSFGKNGHGAFTRRGGATRVISQSAQGTVGSTNADEQKNCHCNQAGAAVAFDDIFVQRPFLEQAASQNVFDDIVMYGTRAILRSAAE